MPRREITQSRLRQVVEYDPNSGHFTWLVTIGRAIAGRRAGSACKRHRYVFLQIDGRIYRAHRLAWLYVTGAWPAHQIDHRDLNRANNAWKNLREATPSLNRANTLRYANNSSGFKGVVRRNKKYQANIQVNGRQIRLGVYATAEQAHAVYCAEAAKRFGQFFNDGS